MMFGYACNETKDFMPMPIWYAHRLADDWQKSAKDGTVPFFGQTAKPR